MPAFYNNSQYLFPSYAEDDYFDIWILSGSSGPITESLSALYNQSSFLIPGFFDSDYFSSYQYNNESTPGPIIIDMTSSIQPEFNIYGDIYKGFVLSSIMSPEFVCSSQMVEGIVFGSVISPTFDMSSNTAVFYSMTSDIAPTFTFSSTGVGRLNRKSFVLAIDRGYFMARQGHHVLNFYVMAR